MTESEGLLADTIHGVIDDVCNRIDDEDPGRVLCFEIAAALIESGWRHVGTEEDRDT